MRYLALITVSCLFFSGCARIDVFERTIAIPKHTWYHNNKPGFTFTITDTSAPYNLFVVLRHTDAYRYNNIWLSVGSKAPGEMIKFQRIDITLGNDATGWEGHGMDDIFELRKSITNGPVPFKKAGNYTFTIGQVMRENPLKNILNVGVRVEKVKL